MSTIHSLEEVQIDFSKTNNSILELQSTINDSILYSDKLDNIHSLLNTSNSLNNISIEAIQLSLNIIYDNLGASSYSLSNRYSLEEITDNYKTLALENVSSFIRELWVKIKSSIKTLWDKVNNFWDNNFSNLRRVQLALDLNLDKINRNYKVTSSTLSNIQNESLVKSFNNLKDIDERTLEDFISTHQNNFNKLDEIIKGTKYFNQHIKTISDEEVENTASDYLGMLTKNLTAHPFMFGEEKYPIISGEYITINYEYDEDKVDLEISTNKETLDNSVGTTDIYYINNTKLKQLIKRTNDIILTTMKYKDIQHTIQKEFDELVRVYDIIIRDKGDNLSNDYKRILKFIYKLNSCIPALFSLIVLSNVKLARSMVNYVEFCLHKPD